MSTTTSVKNIPQSRVCILLMDSLGIGESNDAAQYGDTGANTLGHIVNACRTGKADQSGLRKGPLKIPHLHRLGLIHAAVQSGGNTLYQDEDLSIDPAGYYGYAVEKSLGKDTPSGHWELMGVPVMYDWGYFKDGIPCFPDKLIKNFIARTGVPGVLGQKHASGTTIIEELGMEHQKTGMPIVYTSGDSVFQIAAHEDSFGLDRLYDVCNIARELVDEYHVGRVIARPFVGEPGAYKRTGNRRDYSTKPPEYTMLDYLKNAGRDVIAIGKVADIFAHQGITQNIKADGNMAIFDKTLQAFESLPAGGLVFANFVDFDSSYGHRRDVPGYAHALEMFDARIPELEAILHEGDIVVIAADHGCDPTRSGSDHTREHIPVLVFGPGLKSFNIGRRETFADVGQTLAEYFGLKSLAHGVSFLSEH